MRRAREVVDDMLVLSCQNGDDRALELLARRWHPRLVRHAYRLTGSPDAAADAAQEAWIGIVRGLRGLRDPARFGSWALRIVGNKSRDWIRAETRRRGAAHELEVRQTPSGVRAAGPGSGRDPDDKVLELRRAMARLSDEQRVIMRLFYVEDRSVRDIAEIVGLPVGTVKSRLFYARRRLREAVLGAGEATGESRQDDEARDVRRARR